jgi:hypothetical protein
MLTARLIECDRSFTRSDALAKHMRTVHETEALRPSDPVPKHHSSKPPAGLSQRLKLILKKDSITNNGVASPSSPSLLHPPTHTHDTDDITYVPDPSSPTGIKIAFPSDIKFSRTELDMPAPELLQLLRRQLKWAEEESKELEAEMASLEKSRFEEWMRKELTLENELEADLLRMMRKKKDMGVDVEGLWPVLEEDLGPARRLAIKASKDGQEPWWRAPEWYAPVDEGKAATTTS